MNNGKEQPFGQRIHTADDPYKRYLDKTVILGFPSDGLNGGYVKEISEIGFIFNPYVFRNVDAYELEHNAAGQLVSYGSISRVTPVSEKRLKDMIEELNSRLKGEEKPKPKNSLILMPDEVSLIVPASFNPLAGAYIPRNGF